MKTPPQKKENKSRLQHGLEEGEAESGKSMMPPTFQLLASPADEDEGSPKQMKWNGFGGSIESDGYGINDRNRNTNLFKTKGSIPKKEKIDADAGLGITGADWDKSSKNPGYDNGNGLKIRNAATSGGAYANTTKRGIEAGVNAKGSLALVEYQRSWPFGPFYLPIFKEMTAMNFELSVRGFLGVEGKANFEANIAKLQATKNPLSISQKNLKAGAALEAEAFAGAKIELGAKADYSWIKKKPEEYASKITANLPSIIDEISKLNPMVGNYLKQLPVEENAKLLASFLFSLGGESPANLAEAEVGAMGAAGVAARASVGARLTRGKFYFHAKASAAWGLGFGADASIGLDIVDGTLFGLVAGGEMLREVIPNIKQLLSPKHLLHLGGMLYSRIEGLFGNSKTVPKAGVENRTKKPQNSTYLGSPKDRGPQSGWV